MTELTVPQYQAKAEARFWAKVDKTETCWNWTGHHNENGYGLFSLNYPGDSKPRTRGAHRFSWSLVNGPIPKSVEIDHMCHNTLCVRPDHLRPATRKENSENRLSGNAGSKSGIRGVHWDASKGRWRARVYHDGRAYHLGHFTDATAAGEAAKAKRLELHTFNLRDQA